MNYQDIFVQANDGIVTITLDRPQVMNALSPRLIAELRTAIEQVAQDPTARVLIVTGAGKAFSAGADLKALATTASAGRFDPALAAQMEQDGKQIIHTLQTMPQVAIAMVNGACFTGALELLMAFDLMIAADTAQFGDTHCKWGLVPRWGMSQRLPHLVGILKARELSYTAQAIDAAEAQRIGLINRVVPAEKLVEETYAWAAVIKQNSAQAIAAMKQLYEAGMHTTLREGLNIEEKAQFTINDSAEQLKNFSKK